MLTLIFYAWEHSKVMLEFIVLGKIPGTQVQLDFVVLLIWAAVFVSVILIVLLVNHIWHRLLDAARAMYRLKLAL